MMTGILPVDKPKGVTSFSMVAKLRKISGIKKIGHSGTLDPFASGVLILLLGREYTRLADQFLLQDKEYLATIRLGCTSDTYDPEGVITKVSDRTPSMDELDLALESFQGEISQVPPMFSAKKVQGKKLYELARKGITIDRKPSKVRVKTELLAYEYPYVTLKVSCSKGTYIRSIAHDLGERLKTGAYLQELVRTRSGKVSLDKCVKLENLKPDNLSSYFIQHESI